MELTLKNLTPLGPPIPVYERRVKIAETEDFDLGFHEFHFEEKNSGTTHPLTLNFTERDLDTLVTGFEQTPVSSSVDLTEASLDMRADADITEIYGHGRMAPKTVKTYEHSHRVTESSVLKSIFSRIASTRVSVGGRTVEVSDGFRQVNLELDSGDEVEIVSKNPNPAIHRIGFVDLVLERVAGRYVNLTGVLETS